MRRSIPWLLCFAVSGLGAVSAAAEEWGDFTATFVLNGQAPKAPACKITQDADFCGKFGLCDESLVVNDENQGIANVVVYLYLARGEEAPPAHPDYQETAESEVVLDNDNCRFSPHVALLRSTQTLVVGNSDPIGHNCKIDTFSNAPINYTVPAKGKMEHQFPLAERLPSKVTCSIHPWMHGWVLIRDNPYMGVSDKNGKLIIKNLPVGKWILQVWHEKVGFVDTVKRNGTSEQWRRGRVEVEIVAGENDLGQIQLAPSAFVD
jgi:hypothetical protein